MWEVKNSRMVEEAMNEIRRRATVRAWLYAYDLLVADPVPDLIPLRFTDSQDRRLLETLRKELEHGARSRTIR